MAHPLLKFSLFTYTGDEVDDHETWQRLPADLRDVLRHTNGLVAYRGGFHLRGAVLDPAWHAISTVWDGALSLHRAYSDLRDTDVPFAQDALGDQYLLRDARVVRLWAETGDVEPLHITLAHFLTRVAAVPYQSLHIQPLQRFQDAGGQLRPGQLLRADPPFCLPQDGAVALEAVDAGQRIFSLATLSLNLPVTVTLEGIDLVEVARRRRT